MRVAETFVVEWVDDEAVVLDPRTGDVHYLNRSGAYTYALIQERGFEAAVSELRVSFGDVPGMKEELDQLIEGMVEKGLLIDD